MIAFFSSFSHSFNAILASRSFSHLRAMYDEYEKISKKNMEGALVSELSGDVLSAYLAIGEHMKITSTGRNFGFT